MYASPKHQVYIASLVSVCYFEHTSKKKDRGLGKACAAAKFFLVGQSAARTASKIEETFESPSPGR